MAASPPHEHDDPHTGCPPHHVLQTLADGAAPDERTRRHIDTCIRCQHALDTLFQDEDLLAELAGAMEVTTPDAPTAPGDAAPPRIGEYEVQGELHRGGQGVVYKAWHPPTKRTVALKVMLNGAFATTRQHARFEREVELVASLRHPGIVTLHDSGVTPDGLRYLVMEYVEGIRLHEYRDALAATDADGRPPLRQTLELFRHICDAVGFAQRRGIIHRDLKPANILITPDGQPHILDFGIAKLDAESRDPDDGVTIEGEFVGTFSYAAPEQVSGAADAVDIRTDVYALGIILYELLTAQRPRVLSGSMADFVRAITETEPVRPSLNRPDLRGDPEVIILTAMARDPDRRYQSARELRDDIDNYLAGRPITARADSTLYVLRKSAGRYRVPLAIAALVLILLLASVGMFIRSRFVDAERRIKAAESVDQLGFIKEIFAATDWRLSGERVNSVPEFLDVTARNLEVHLQEHPEILASIQIDVGRAYLNENIPDQLEKAFDNVRRSLEIRRRTLSEPHDDIADALFLLGRVRWNQERFEEAEGFYRSALAMRLQLHPERSDEVADARHHLASTLSRLNRDDEWIGLYDQALAAKESLHGAESIKVAIVRNSRAVSFRDTRRSEEALDEFASVLTILEALLEDPDADIRVALVLNNIASTCLDARADDGLSPAIDALSRSLAIQRRWYGERSPKVCPALLQHARLRLRRAALAADQAEARTDIMHAAAHAAEAATILKVEYPAGHPDLAEAHTLAGEAFLAAADPATARLHLQAARDLWLALAFQHAASDPDWRAAVSDSLLGACQAALGDNSPETERLLASSLTTLRTLRGPEARETRDACTRYAAWLRDMQRPVGDDFCATPSASPLTPGDDAAAVPSP